MKNLIRDHTIHSSVYTSSTIFKLELEKIFHRSWLLVGHDSQVPSVGDWICVDAGDVPLIIIRSGQGEIKAYINSCTHRNARLLAGRKGNARAIVCPYHGWTFSLEGALKKIPLPEEYPPTFQASARDLKTVAQLQVYRGFIFVNPKSADTALFDYLGHMKSSIDDLVDRSPENEIEIIPQILKHRYRGNWKLTLENLNDTLHAGVAHAAAASAAHRIKSRTPSHDHQPQLDRMLANAKPVTHFQNLRMVTERCGHSYFGAHMPVEYPSSINDEYFSRLAQAKGETEARRILGIERHLTILYPGAVFHGRFQTVRILRPIAPDLTEVTSMLFRLKGAPDGTLVSSLAYYNSSSSAMSNVITDDLDIYEGIQRSCYKSPGWLEISRGAADSEESTGLHTQAATSEAYIRNQYRAWADYLEKK